MLLVLIAAAATLLAPGCIAQSDARNAKLGDLSVAGEADRPVIVLGSEAKFGRTFRHAASLLARLGEAEPESVDWRQQGAVSPVKDQKRGSQGNENPSCGSCWAFAAAGALEGAWKIKTGDMVDLSEQQLMDCTSPDEGCEPGQPWKAIDYARTTDLCTESSYPYRASTGVCADNSCTFGGLPSSRIQDFYEVPPRDEAAMKRAVAKQPVSACIKAFNRPRDRHYGNSFDNYTGGVMRDCPFDIQTDHCILVVGYGSDAAEGNYWLVKNSWGEGWGEQGYVRIGRGSGGDAGECGILAYARHPVILPPSYVLPVAFTLLGVAILAFSVLAYQIRNRRLKAASRTPQTELMQQLDQSGMALAAMQSSNTSSPFLAAAL